ncbi:MAG TPA: virulence factor Mce family protein [Mycobacterium sp.]
MWQGLALLMGALMLSSCGWKGISNVPVPGVPGSGSDAYTVYVQMPDTLALNGNSRVLVADVWVGSIRAIELKNWVPTLTVGLKKSVKLPKNAHAKIGQTSLLGSQHVELSSPDNASAELLKNGDTIALKNSSTYPNLEQVMATLSLILRGGGVPNLEVLQNEVYNIVNGRAPQIRDLLGKLKTFTGALNEQRFDINRAIDSTNVLMANFAKRADVLDRLFTETAPLSKYLAEKQQLYIDASNSVGRFAAVTNQYLAPAAGNLHQDLVSLQCPLKEVENAGPFVPDLLKFGLTIWPVDAAQKSIRGDYINTSFLLDATYSRIDNMLLTGTGYSGALRALEQSFGHSPENMVPDVRYTPNASSANLIERGDRNC